MRWVDRWMLGRTPETAGRVGETVTADGWTLLVSSVEHVESLAGATGAGDVDAGDGAGFLVVDLVLTASEPVDGRTLTLAGDGADFELVDADGRRSPPAGVPVDWAGGARLLRGRPSVTLRGSPVRNDASWSLRLAFDLTDHSPPAELRATGLPPVRLEWTPARPAPPDPDGDTR
jgi:hypothetical protein